MTREEVFMQRAIDLAVSNANSGRGGPFGALVTRGDEIVSEGMNLVTSANDPTAHAEVVAIRRACEKLGTWQLSGCDLYTSCEPCPMCLGAIYWARPNAILYAASHEDASEAGFDDSFIYQQLRKSASERQIVMRRVLASQGKQPFAAWLKLDGRIPY